MYRYAYQLLCTSGMASIACVMTYPLKTSDRFLLAINGLGIAIGLSHPKASTYPNLHVVTHLPRLYAVPRLHLNMERNVCTPLSYNCLSLTTRCFVVG